MDLEKALRDAGCPGDAGGQAGLGVFSLSNRTGDELDGNDG